MKLATKALRSPLSLLGLSALFFVINSTFVSYPDEFINLLGGRAILLGKLPYRDFFDHHMPLAWYLNNSDRSNPHRLLSLLAKLQNPSYISPLSPEVTLFTEVPHSIAILLHGSPMTARDRLSARVTTRLAQGAIEECQGLLKQGHTPDMPGLQTLGYTQLFAYLSGNLPLAEATDQWLTAECKYAKRQKTYFKKYFPTAEIILV
jgi:hypothetical protein